ncbi:MAG: flagellar biosynthesis protein FlhF, partial [Pseudomonadota bacterium]|nr:flagellar biosynthesis protein FlhF [Pseudomonadota bacterium]
MKVKRFFAQSMAEALKQVSHEMGPDAVILSNRRVDGGVEIVTALDYDENMARQRLGERAVEATNGSRLAEMQAEQHRRLEEELNRSRSRIREVREKRAGNASSGGTASSMSFETADFPASLSGTVVAEKPASGRESGTGGYADELASMRAEISSLRDLVSGKVASTTQADGGNSAVQQRLAERLQEFGLGAELAGSLSR